MKFTRRSALVTGIWFAAMCSTVFAQVKLGPNTFGGGGGVSTNGTSLIAGTLAQTIIGPVTSGTNAVGQGFWYILAQMPVTSGVHYEPVAAGSSAVLHPNFPNPFSTTTEIAFDLPQAGTVSLKLFDAVGHEVRTLVAGNRPVGRSTITLNGADLESGYYTARLVVNGATSAISLVVVR